MEAKAAVPNQRAAEEPLSALYLSHYRDLARLGLLLTGSAAVAEELVQEAFVRIQGRSGQLHDPGAGLAYLRATVANLARSRLRRQRVIDRLHLKPPPAPPGPDEAALASLEAKRVIDALAALPVRQREAVVLRFYGQLTESEVAEAMGVSVGSVRGYNARAIGRLRHFLEDLR